MNTTISFAFIVNPTGGGGNALKHWSKLLKLLVNSVLSYKVFTSEYSGHAITLAQTAIEEGFDHIVAVGGDGTASQVANGILTFHEIEKFGNIAMSLYSCGTGNDWIKAHNISKKPERFLQGLLHRSYAYQDVGKAKFHKNNEEKTYFIINVAGLAYDAYVAKRSSALKNKFMGGKFYLFYVFRWLLDYKPGWAHIQDEKVSIEAKVYTINVGICPYSGGNMRLVPHAVPDDGQLAVTVVTSMPKWEVVLQTAKFYNGKLGDHPNTTMWHANQVSIESKGSQQIGLEIDGEYLGETPVEIQVLPKALRIFGSCN